MENNFCECGCGQKCRDRFVNGHNRKGQKNSDYQKEMARKAMLENNPSKRPEVAEKIRQAHLGKPLSEEHRAKLKITNFGENNGFYGKHHSEETKEILRQQRIGKSLSEEHKNKLILSAKRGDDNPAKRPEVRIKIGLKSKGRVHSLETIRKMKDAKKGYQHSEGTKAKIKATRLYGDDNPSRRPDIRKLISQKNKGRTYSDEVKRNMSIAQLLRFQNPENHPRWKGGICKDEYCEIWKDQEYKSDILKRDNYQCQNPNCWESTDLLSVHHIDYIKKNCHPDNLITLCRSCNARANSKRKDWHMFYEKTMQNKKPLVVNEE